MKFSGLNIKMRLKNSLTIGEALDQMIKDLKLRPKMDEVRIQEEWERIMGKTIAKYTKEIKLMGGKLYLKVESAPLKQELLYSRERIIEMLDKELSIVIYEVVIY
jgi:predicted nucleic acid-binding Zn ribbon protein